MEIDYLDYEKAVDDLFYIDSNTVLRFNVILNRKDKEGKRIGFHSEVKYPSAKYNNKSIINIRRKLDYFLSIENFKPSPITGEKEFIMIGVKDILALRIQLNNVYKWFSSEQFKNLYAIKDNKLIILGGVEPIIVDGLPMGKFLQIEPIVYEYDNKYSMGVRISLSSMNNYCDINIDSFMGLKYLIDSINMYESAQLLLNYVGRPAYGTNLFEFQNDYINENQDGYVDEKKPRVIPSTNKRQKSFFQLDKL